MISHEKSGFQKKIIAFSKKKITNLDRWRKRDFGPKGNFFERFVHESISEKRTTDRKTFGHTTSSRRRGLEGFGNFRRWFCEGSDFLKMASGPPPFFLCNLPSLVIQPSQPQFEISIFEVGLKCSRFPSNLWEISSIYKIFF